MKYELQTSTTGRVCGRTSLTGILHLADTLTLDMSTLSFTIEKDSGFKNDIALYKQVLWTKDMKGNLSFHTDAINDLVEELNEERSRKGLDPVSFF